MDPTNRTTLDTGLSLGELAATHPNASRVFRALGLDYCCGGRKSLADACAEKRLDAETVLRSIADDPALGEPNWTERPLTAVIQHILERYHEPLRSELPELRRMAETVESKHAEKPECPRNLSSHLASIHEAVLSHLEKEERILFPLIIAGRGAQAGGPIQVMEMEHDEHGTNLALTRSLTNDLVAPAWACPTWQALYVRLRQLEADLMDHISLENNVLFPRALCES